MNILVSSLRSIFEAFKNDLHLRRLLGNGLTLLTSHTIVSLLQFLQVIVLTRFLLPAGYGIFTLVIAYVDLFEQFFDVRVEEMTVQFGTEYHSRGDSDGVLAIIKVSYFIDFVTGVFAFIVVMLSAPWATRVVLHNPALAPLVQLYSVTLLLATLNGTNNSALRILDRYKWISVYAVTVVLVECLVTIIAVLMGAGVKGILIVLIVQEVFRLCASTSLALYALRESFGWNKIRRTSLGYLRGRFSEIGKLLFHTNFIAYFRMINTRVDVLILGVFRSEAEVGIYKFGRALATIVARVSDPFLTAILPDLGRLWTALRVKEYEALIRKSSISMTLVLIPLAIGTSLTSKLLCRAIAGNAYVEAAPVFIICIWAFTIGGIFFWTWPAAISIGRADYGTRVGAIGCAVQLLVALALVPISGSMGTSIALLSTYLVSQPLLAWLIVKKIRGHELSTAATSFG